MSSQHKTTLSICRRFAFSSALRRMAVVGNTNLPLSLDTPSTWYVAVKGAPEALHPLFRSTPDWYVEVYQEYARKGLRIIALGFKPLAAKITQQEVGLERRGHLSCADLHLFVAL